MSSRTSSRRESTDTIHEEATRRYSIVTKLVHYTSKFTLSDGERRSNLQTPNRLQASSRNDRRRSTVDISDRSVCFCFIRNHRRIIFSLR